MTQVTPEVLLAGLGLLSTAAGWLAGRNRQLADTLRTITPAYQALIAELRTEVDRLHVQVAQLQAALSGSRRRNVRKIDPTTGL